MRPRLALLAALVAGLLLAWSASRTPRPRPADAPASTFSAERAMDDVRAVARRPHPSGSLENRRVRDYLVARLRSLGLEVRTAESRGPTPPGSDPQDGAGRPISNIIAVLPGSDRTLPALAVMAHYDSAPGSPGAADDAAGVAAALEIARAVQATGQPRRDLVLLITDGEELGLLGAADFFGQGRGAGGETPPDPLARRIGLVLNMEARGGGGRAFMFETGPNNGRLVSLYGREAVGPSSSSLAVYLYGIMNNATDFSVARQAGIPGLNWAFIGRPAQYHDPSSTAEALDGGSVQHIGQQVLPVARSLLDSAQLPPPAPNAVYSDVLGLFLLAYPPWVGWLVLAAALGLAALAWRRPPPAGEVALGLVGGLVLLVLTAVALRLTFLVGSLAGRRALLENFGLYELALAAACVLPALLIFARLARRRERSVSGLWLGFVLLGLLLTAALQILAPTTAHTVAWPTLLACAAAVFAARAPDAPVALLVATAASALVIGQVGAWSHGVALGVGDFLPEPLAAFALLVWLPLAPLLLTALRPRTVER
ncbi:MAG: M20/M25/M40 family metallo-hydrolase [Proteobacteria bacterium]|nr:M20/M25/M40 family metallo-hydrolase [Pseudomonadota bacterium]